MARAVDLDLTPFVGGRLSLTMGDYTFSLPSDFPTPLLIAVNKAMTLFGRASQGEDVPDEKVQEADAEMWRVLSEIMENAEPAPPKPVRELFTNVAAIRLLSFLLNSFREAPASKGAPRQWASPAAADRPG